MASGYSALEARIVSLEADLLAERETRQQVTDQLGRAGSELAQKQASVEEHQGRAVAAESELLRRVAELSAERDRVQNALGERVHTAETQLGATKKLLQQASITHAALERQLNAR
jgi:chromosome segregation ATPase